VTDVHAFDLTTRGRWDDAEAAAFAGPLAERVYTSRLLGRDAALVLHGGGNTSVKIAEPDIFGRDRHLLYVKGSGWDLATIEAAGFAPVRMDVLLALAELDALSDAEMARQLRLATCDPAAPAPSVEAILHALLPFRFVDHTHPDALLSVMNTPSGRERIDAIYGDRVVVVPYVMPGFLLARACAVELRRGLHAGSVGMVLMNHGLFTWGETARESYQRSVDLVAEAEAYLRAHGAWEAGGHGREQVPVARGALARLRSDLSAAAGTPLVVRRVESPNGLAFARRPDVERVSQSGPATPDHVIRTKRVPLVGRDVAAYVEAYGRYFAANAGRSAAPLTMLDPAPRVVLDEELGLVVAGPTAAAAEAAGDIYAHTIDIIERAERLESWQALPEGDVFDVEYWELEQAKLKSTAKAPPLAGEIALVTGAASGIGRACVEALAARGAAVAGLDIDPAVDDAGRGPGYLGLECDVTSEASVVDALEAAVRRFGGLDVVVLNAGIFPASAPLETLGLDAWRRTMGVNLDANLVLLREAYPLLRLSPRGGRVVVVGSKNVPAPGPGAAAYSASKAALTQLARVAALEWGADGIRVNVVHPNAVFDTGIWSDEVVERRAASYGLSADEYRRNNVLRTEVGSADVARLVCELCGPAFAKTTGAQIPIDGGNERVI
jgi:rhamnose utilization protein RhaD (predicted bifunctional aldolase and dehydrogenase)/NAD(P)-dependent dehydrogenase (short-subunit alcohol dehydrogenase family)